MAGEGKTPFRAGLQGWAKVPGVWGGVEAGSVGRGGSPPAEQQQAWGPGMRGPARDGRASQQGGIRVSASNFFRTGVVQ